MPNLPAKKLLYFIKNKSPKFIRQQAIKRYLFNDLLLALLMISPKKKVFTILINIKYESVKYL